jgi:hypothetical protein
MLTFSRFSKAATAKRGCPGYAGSPNPSSRPQATHPCDMPSTTTEIAEERPARKAKKESKVCTLLSILFILNRTLSSILSLPARDHGRNQNPTSHPVTPNLPIHSQVERKIQTQSLPIEYLLGRYPQTPAQPSRPAPQSREKSLSRPSLFLPRDSRMMSRRPEKSSIYLEFQFAVPR